jgi:UDP-glucose:(heptosyl)LPS alpha-1,3-glucosyltransferase
MNIAFCYESVLPARGGCETYISDLARKLVADHHEVHLYACVIDKDALPESVRFHQLERPRGPRFIRPWTFGFACERALRTACHDVTIGFDKTWGQDILYPQGGLHSASFEHNLRKYPSSWMRGLARLAKRYDPAHRSFVALERKQYLAPYRPAIIVNSFMVREHFQQFYGIPDYQIHVVRSSFNPDRFAGQDRPRRRVEWRRQWGIGAHETVGLFVAMNYRLKGLDPLLHALTHVPPEQPFRLLVVGNPNFARYERLAQKLGVRQRVCFVGMQRDVQNCYYVADLMIHPTFYDPGSLVVLEALTCGLPVITTRYNGAAELLTPPRDGYVVEDPHDHARLGWCITQLLDEQRRFECAVAARRTAANWTFDRHYRQIMGIFERVRSGSGLWPLPSDAWSMAMGHGSAAGA